MIHRRYRQTNKNRYNRQTGRQRRGKQIQRHTSEKSLSNQIYCQIHRPADKKTLVKARIIAHQNLQ